MFENVKFRPSSHSEDYTIFARFKDAATAQHVAEILKKLLEDMEKHPEDYEIDWLPDEAKVTQYGDTVEFTVYTAGYLQEVEATLRKYDSPTELKVYRDYQELTIRLHLPEGATLETLPLLLDSEDLAIVRWLNQNCGEPQVIIRDGKKLLAWHYAGDAIYYDGILYTDKGNPIGEKDYWEIIGGN